MIEIGVGVFVGAVEGEDELLVELPPDRRSRLRITALATSSICTASFQNHRAQSLYLAYTARSEDGINPRGRSVTTFVRRCFR
jgi:hypothetical protein